MGEYFVSEKTREKKKRSKMYKGGSLQRKEVEKKGWLLRVLLIC